MSFCPQTVPDSVYKSDEFVFLSRFEPSIIMFPIELHPYIIKSFPKWDVYPKGTKLNQHFIQQDGFLDHHLVVEVVLFLGRMSYIKFLNLNDQGIFWADSRILLTTIWGNSQPAGTGRYNLPRSIHIALSQLPFFLVTSTPKPGEKSIQMAAWLADFYTWRNINKEREKSRWLRWVSDCL